jgi:hypothetical protein
MTTGVLDVLENYLIEHGDSGRRHVCKAVRKSPRTLDRWRKDGIPDPHDAYRVALACGCDKDRALELAKAQVAHAEAEESA